MADSLAIFRSDGFGSRLFNALDQYASEYVYSPDDGGDHDPTEFERMLLHDMLAGAFAEPTINAILQEAARGMKAGGMDPEGQDIQP